MRHVFWKHACIFLNIGVTRFELAISRPPDEHFTRLSHTPTLFFHRAKNLVSKL